MLGPRAFYAWLTSQELNMNITHIYTHIHTYIYMYVFTCIYTPVLYLSTPLPYIHTDMNPSAFWESHLNSLCHMWLCPLKSQVHLPLPRGTSSHSHSDFDTASSFLRCAFHGLQRHDVAVTCQLAFSLGRSLIQHLYHGVTHYFSGERNPSFQWTTA